MILYNFFDRLKTFSPAKQVRITERDLHFPGNAVIFYPPELKRLFPFYIPLAGSR